MFNLANVAKILTVVALLTTTTQAQTNIVRPYCGMIEVVESEQQIDANRTGRYYGYGSFVIVADNVVLTNEHNVRTFLEEREEGIDDNFINLYFYNRQSRRGKVVAVNAAHDLALVRFSGLPEGAHRIGIADVQASVSITVAGFPGGQFQNYLEQVRNEFYSDRRYSYSFKFPGTYHVGYSGSPVIDSEGYLTGLLWGCDFDGDNSCGYATRIEHIRDFLIENKILKE